MLLFHGTTTTDPRIIIDSDEGLDIRFNGKNATAYGKGIYFHQTASYSIGFAHQNARGRNREMLVAKVLVGDTQLSSVSGSCGSAPLTRPSVHSDAVGVSH